MRLIVVAGMLLSLCGVVLAADANPAYKIVLDRASKVGEKFNIAVTVTDQTAMTTTADGKVIGNDDDKLAIRLEGTVEVLAVNARKDVVKEALTIARCVKLDGEKETPLAEQGTVVMISADGKDTQYTVDGKPVSETLKAALSMAVRVSDEESSPDDDVFGTRKAQRVGNSWTLSSRKIASTFSEATGAEIEAKDVSGKATLKEVVTVGDQRCLRITADVRMNNITPPGDFPAEMNVTTATLSFSLSGLFPIDTTQRRVEEQEKMTMEIKAEGQPDPDGPIVSFLATVKRTVTTKYSKAE